MDQQHAKGLSENGGFDIFRGTRGIENVNAPLLLGGIDFPVQAGDLTLTVTDPTSGNRTSHRISVDPFADSLTDVAARFNAIPGVTSFISADTGRLTISGDGTQKIDFAGRVDNVPDLTSYTSAAVPEFSGSYRGASNDEWTVSFNQAGTIGVTDGLTANVLNGAGQLVATIDVGSGYEAGTPLLIGDGVSVSFASGDVTTSDSASVLVTADSDPTGLLAALGLNSLFEGSEIGSYQLRREIVDSPELMAISATGFPGESSNMAALANLRDLRIDALDDRTFIEELADFTADAGLQVQQSQNQKEQLESQSLRLAEEQAAISGVSTDEEFLRMLEVERAFQAAAKFISSVDENLSGDFPDHLAEQRHLLIQDKCRPFVVTPLRESRNLPKFPPKDGTTNKSGDVVQNAGPAATGPTSLSSVFD